MAAVSMRGHGQKMMVLACYLLPNIAKILEEKRMGHIANVDGHEDQVNQSLPCH